MDYEFGPGRGGGWSGKSLPRKSGSEAKETGATELSCCSDHEHKEGVFQGFSGQRVNRLAAKAKGQLLNKALEALA